jgi:phage shock protein A
MFKRMMTLFRGRVNDAAAEIAERNALVILDQQIRDAGHGISQAKRALTMAMAEDAQEAARLDAFGSRVADLEARARAALAGGREDLALMAAEAIAELELDQSAAREARQVFGVEIARMRTALAEAERRFADLHRGRRLARVGEAVRQTRNFGGALGVSEAEATLAALRERQTLEAGADQAMQTLSAATRTIELRLGDAGFGAGRPTAQSVLARLKPLAITRA